MMQMMKNLSEKLDTLQADVNCLKRGERGRSSGAGSSRIERSRSRLPRSRRSWSRSVRPSQRSRSRSDGGAGVNDLRVDQADHRAGPPGNPGEDLGPFNGEEDTPRGRRPLFWCERMDLNPAHEAARFHDPVFVDSDEEQGGLGEDLEISASEVHTECDQ